MSMIDDIRRDRKSGTAGPWDANPTHPVDGWNGWKLQQHLEDDYGADIGDIHGGQDNPTQKANARRIARLPDLEAAYLAEVERSKAIELCLMKCIGQMENALAEFEDCSDADFFDPFCETMTLGRAALAAYEGKNDG